MNLKVIEAEYGVGSQVMDVTELLNKKIKDNELVVSVTNQAFNKAPAPNKPKTLKLKYELDNKVIDKEYREGVIVEIPEKKIKRTSGRFTLNLEEVTLATACWGNESFLTSAIWAYKQFKNKVKFGEVIFFISESINTDEYKQFFADNNIRVEPVDNIIFMHTTNLNPTPFNLVRLGSIKELESLVGKNAKSVSQNDAASPSGPIKSLTFRLGTKDDRLRIYW